MTEPLWVCIERADRTVEAFGPYPSVEDADFAMLHSLLIEAETEEDVFDWWVCRQGDIPFDSGRILIDLTDPHHT